MSCYHVIMKRQDGNAQGFTLLELIVTIVVVVILIGIVLLFLGP